MAVWALGQLRTRAAITELASLQDDTTEVEIYEDLKVTRRTIKDLAREALARIRD
jgi:hypothetical protein